MEVLTREYQSYNIKETVDIVTREWPGSLKGIDAIVLPNGVSKEGAGSNRINTNAFFSWFFKCDIPNAVFVITKTGMLFYGSKEKVNFLEPLKEKVVKDCRLDFNTTVREKDNADGSPNESLKNFIKQISSYFNAKSPVFGVVKNENHSGKIYSDFNEQVQKALQPENRDITPQLLRMVATKRADDLRYIKKCGEFLSKFFGTTVSELEKIIDAEEQKKHSAISEQVMGLFETAKAEDASVESVFLDLSFVPSIQSGEEFNLKQFSESDGRNLSFDVIMINLMVKYFDFNTAAVRTLLINASPQEEEAYKLLFKAHEFLISELRPGSTFAQVYIRTFDFLVANKKELASSLPSSFGAGIGIEFKEANTVINKKCEESIREGMVLYVVISMKNLASGRGKTFSLMVADTVIVEKGRNSVITAGIAKEFGTISYSMQLSNTPSKVENEAPEVKVEEERKSSKMSGEKFEDDEEYNQFRPSHVITRNKKKKLAEPGFVYEKTVYQKIQEHQSVLLRQKAEELKDRLRHGDFNLNFGTRDQIKLVNIQAYRSRDEIAKKNRRNKIEVDIKNDVIWIPVVGHMIPFSIAVIKNVSLQHEGQFTSFRINFNVPHLTNKMNIIFPRGIDFNPIYLKELTFRSADRTHFEELKQVIKSMIRDFSATVLLRNISDPTGGLIPIQGKKPVMEDLKMWPPFSGKRTFGRLELHKNGFKFRSTKNEELDILFVNIKHAVYQPSEGEEIILLHFNLKQPLIVGRKKTHDIQFFADVGMIPEDLYDIRRKRTKDFPEDEEDRMYEDHKLNLDRAFGGFVESVERETNNQIKFDVPFRNIGFPGIFLSTTEMIYPTVNCLVSLAKNPYLVVSIDEIEVVILERVGFMNKNFDMVIIFKDYSKTTQLINAIPAKMRDTIKIWLE